MRQREREGVCVCERVLVIERERAVRLRFGLDLEGESVYGGKSAGRSNTNNYKISKMKTRNLKKAFASMSGF